MKEEQIGDRIKLDLIISAIINVMGVDITTAPTRDKYSSDLRRIYGHIANDITHLTLSEIGRKIKKHHSTVIHYIKSTDNLLLYDRDFRKLYYEIKNRLEVDLPYTALKKCYEHYRDLTDRYYKLMLEKENV